MLLLYRHIYLLYNISIKFRIVYMCLVGGTISYQNAIPLTYFKNISLTMCLFFFNSNTIATYDLRFKQISQLDLNLDHQIKTHKQHLTIIFPICNNIFTISFILFHFTFTVYDNVYLEYRQCMNICILLIACCLRKDGCFVIFFLQQQQV